MPDVQNAGVYLRKGNLYIASSATTEAGFLIDQPPYLALPSDSLREHIGAAVRWALRESKMGVPTPSVEEMEAERPSENPVYRLAGAGGHRTFARGTRYVSVRLEGDTVRISPSRTEVRGSFEFVPELAFSAPAATDVELADAVRSGLDICQTLGER